MDGGNWCLLDGSGLPPSAGGQKYATLSAPLTVPPLASFSSRDIAVASSVRDGNGVIASTTTVAGVRTIWRSDGYNDRRLTFASELFEFSFEFILSENSHAKNTINDRHTPVGFIIIHQQR